MIISGILTNMNVYVDKLDDIHLSLYDFTYDWMDVFIDGPTI